MICQRLISRFSVRNGLFDQSIRKPRPRSNYHVNALSSLSKNSEQSPKSLSQIPRNYDVFPGISKNLKGQTCLLDNVVPRLLENLGMKLGIVRAKSLPCNVNFRSFIHSAGPDEFDTGRDNRSFESERGRDIRSFDRERGRDVRSFEWERGRDVRTVERERNTGSLEMGWNSRPIEMGQNNRPIQMGMNSRPFVTGWNSGPMETGRNTRSMNFMRGIIEENGRDMINGSQFSRFAIEQNADIVHIKLMRNNTFITVTDSKGNKKIGASSGCLAEKGKSKVSRYGAEATAEHVGRLARNMGLKSVVVKVNGFTYFKKKKQAILSFRDGYTNSRGDQNPIVYIEDTTRRPHNGCRLRKKRRV